MNRNKRGLLVGMVLGDGCIRVRERVMPKGYRYRSQELRMKHSTKQADYLAHKAKLLQSIFGGAVNVRPTMVRIGDVEYPQVLASKSHRYFRALHRVMYPGGRKTITRRVLDYLSDEGMAIWYMDDGNGGVNRNREGRITSCWTVLSTCCARAEADLAAEWMKDRYGMEPKVFHARNDRWSIRLNTADSRSLMKAISQFVIPSMRYKLSHVPDLNAQEPLPA